MNVDVTNNDVSRVHRTFGTVPKEGKEIMSSTTIDLDGQKHQVRGDRDRFVDTLSADARAQVIPLATAIENSRPVPSLSRRIWASFVRVFGSMPLPAGPMSPAVMAELQARRDVELDHALIGGELQ